MSERGYIALARGYFEHESFAKEPFTEREAWVWLIFEAAWKPRRVRRGHTIFELVRGELAHALEFMRRAWKWNSKSRVARFLKRLQNDGMIALKSERDATRITICNYNKYQSVRDAKRNARETPTERQRDELEPLNHLTIKPKEGAPNGAHSPEGELSKVLDQTRTQALIEHRKKKRAPLTAHAAKLLAKKFAATADPNAAADAMIANGWQGFEPEWLANRERQGTGPPKARTVFDAAVDWIAETGSESISENGNGSNVKLLSAARRES